MRRRCDEGKAVFFSTHILDVAERVFDSTAIINRGRPKNPSEFHALCH
jgi:ABC-2 type transport system ATP-binding protein